MDLKTKRVLVTGGHGFVGGHLVDRLRRRGCRDILAPSSSECDLTEPGAARRLFDDYRPDVVIPGAAVVGGIQANQRQPGSFFYLNTLMGIELIEAARQCYTEKVVVLGHPAPIGRLRRSPFEKTTCGMDIRRKSLRLTASPRRLCWFSARATGRNTA
jgi:nucleoside-diphosphate-sugar epimerase